MLIFLGVTLFNPARNMNASEIHVLFGTGVGIRVMENRGILDIMVVIPPDYNETLAVRNNSSKYQFNVNIIYFILFVESL